jgi:dienelactone hydrolase
MVIGPGSAVAAESRGDRMFAGYFREETARVANRTFTGIETLGDWTAQRPALREQLLEMLGLQPWPEKTDLQATITGREEHAEFYVEKLHFQSMPGLYVTGNVYVPKQLPGKAPAILYVCGHAPVKIDGVSYGAKANYQHHGGWFARHGYICLTIDTIQLGELEGLHHGTYREGMWWWNARGYTPGGVEAWNSIRALDYLQSRPDVDGERLGMTGRSGGGGYTWFTAAVDERVKVAVPVAGVTDLHNHVIDGTVGGHCDCMFYVNTHRWDYAKLAAMIAPRPLLFSNTDKDRIFPLDGVQRVHRDVARIYALHKAADKLGLLITEGPHKDTQELQLPALRWFNRFLKGDESPVTDVAVKFFQPPQLRVFAPGALPQDQRTTKIHESFVPMAAPDIPADGAAWRRQRDGWMQALREKAFGGWPEAGEPLRIERTGERRYGAIQATEWEFTSQGVVRLPLVVFSRGNFRAVKQVYLRAGDEKDWEQLLADAARDAAAARDGTAIVVFAPRGVGPTASHATDREKVQIRRRFMLLGQTLDGMRVWDFQRAVEAVRHPALFGGSPVHVSATGHQAVNALYASLFVDGLASVELIAPPASHMTGPDYLNVLRFLDVPQAAAMAAERQPVKWTRSNPDDWSWTSRTARQLGWPAQRLQW